MSNDIRQSEEYWLKIHGIACRIAQTMLRSFRDLVDDVVQNTLLKVVESEKQLRDPAKLEPWVRRIARNQCNDALRARAKQGSSPLPVETEVRRVEQALVEGLDIRRTLQALKSPREQVVLELWLRGYSVKQTAEEIGMSTKTVQRDRQRIKSVFKSLEDEYTLPLSEGRTREHARVSR